MDILALKHNKDNKSGNNTPYTYKPQINEEKEKPEIPKNNENKIKTEIHLKEHLLQQIINSNQTSSEDVKKDGSNNDNKQEEKKVENENLIITKINDE